MTRGAGRSPLLLVRQLCVSVGRTRHRALTDVSLSVHRGQRVAVLGPSGCGKSTLLRTIAGFERPDGGDIQLDGATLTGATIHVPPHRRSTGLMFQDYALFPHLSVQDNIGFGIAHVDKVEHTRRVAELLQLVGLTGFSSRKPGELSGGQQQRVALARALAPQPRLLLLDEPFSSLDSGQRVVTRRHTEQVLAKAGVTAILVTHDQAEAMAFAERLIVLRGGRIEQEGSPVQVYESPRNAFVAKFMGAANVMEADARGSVADTPLGPLDLQAPANGKVWVCLRPEVIELVDAEGAVAGRVVKREYQGAYTAYEVQGQGFQVVVHELSRAQVAVGEAVSLRVRGAVAVLAPE